MLAVWLLHLRWRLLYGLLDVRIEGLLWTYVHVGRSDEKGKRSALALMSRIILRGCSRTTREMDEQRVTEIVHDGFIVAR